MRTNPVNLRISDRGLALIGEHEGCILHAYDDADPRHDPIQDGDEIHGTLTIGYGHTRTVQPGMKITEAEAMALLRSDVREAESYIHRFVKCPLSQDEFDAVTSLIFNVGAGRVAGSTGFADKGKSGIITLANGQPSSLLKCLNGIDTPDGKPDYAAAAGWFTAWRKTAGFEFGLFRRRISEMLLFMGLPWKRALNACKNLQFTVAEAVRLAEEEKDDLASLEPPVAKPTPAPPQPQETTIPGKGDGATVTIPAPSPIASGDKPASVELEPSRVPAGGVSPLDPTVPPPPRQATPQPVPVPVGTKPIHPETKMPDGIPYGVDPAAGAKPMEATERFVGSAMMWTANILRVGTANGLKLTGPIGMLAVFFLDMMKTPATAALVCSAIVAVVLFVFWFFGVALDKAGLKKKRRGERTAQQLMY